MSKKEIIVRELEGVPEEDFDALLGFIHSLKIRGTEDAAPALLAESSLTKDWLSRWEKYILSSVRDRYCDREMGEEIGWLVSPFLNGFYYGYLATHDPKWVEALTDWMDSCLKRSVKEPDGYFTR